MQAIPFQKIDWSSIPKTEQKGETGISYSQTVQLGGLRIRLVEYSPGYQADHWCQKGHVVYCLDGEFTTEHENKTEKMILRKGMTYVVSDNLSSHRSASEIGCKLLIVDGEFLA